MSTHPSKSVTSSSSTVQFNVGGKIYEVSRSLLEHHPNTMLARMASEQLASRIREQRWQRAERRLCSLHRAGRR